jgi:hypothetical protein
MDKTVAAALEVLETVESRFGRPVRDDTALVIKGSLYLAITTAVACGALDKNCPLAMADQIKANVLTGVKESMTTNLYLLLAAHRLSGDDAKALTKIIVSQVDRGLQRLNASIGGDD